MNLKHLLAPKSVALIGASNREGTLGYDLVSMILRSNYKGEIYPVNPRYEAIQGLDCFSSIEAIGKPVDLAAICLAASRLDEQVQEAIRCGVKSLIITPNAILENDESPPLAERLHTMLEQAQVPVSGHNSMGYYNNDLDLRVCSFYAPDEGKGNICFISQSGSVFSTIAHNDPQLKFNLAITTGTELNITVADYMLYALEQPTTKVIGLFLETIRDPVTFRRALHLAATKRIPVVAMKVGKSELGSKFTVSHSGGLAGNDDAIDAVFRHYGVLRVSDLDEFANILLLFSMYSKFPAGQVAMVADSGGERNMLADMFDEIGVEFASLSDKTMRELAKLQEFGQEASNPLDPWGTGLDFVNVVGESLALMTNDEQSAFGIISQDMRDGGFMAAGFADAIELAQRKTSKPLAYMTNFAGVRRKETTDRLNAIGVPVLCGTRATIHAVKHCFAFRDFQFEQRDSDGLENWPNRSLEGLLSEYESLKLLGELGIPVVDTHRIQSVKDIRNLGSKSQFPVVLKTAMPDIVHKSDLGGVVLQINDSESLEREYVNMSEKLGPCAIVQPMMPQDLELILGMKTDDVFGPLVIVGAGGVLAEYWKDVQTLLPEAADNEIEKTLRELRIAGLFKGYRGKQGVEIRDLVEVVSRFCYIVQQMQDQILEIDINPLAVSESRIVAVDAVVVCKSD